jgi:hypothetical protein
LQEARTEVLFIIWTKQTDKCEGRGTLEYINTQSMKVESRNRWTASNATILGVASRNSGVFAAGGSGNLRLFHGINPGFREIDLDSMISKIEVDPLYQTEFQNVAEQVYLGCGANGVACVEFGFSPEDEDFMDETSPLRDALLVGEYSDMHYFRYRFA